MGRKINAYNSALVRQQSKWVQYNTKHGDCVHAKASVQALKKHLKRTGISGYAKKLATNAKKKYRQVCSR